MRLCASFAAFCAILLTACAESGPSPAADPRVAWLRASVVPLRSIDPMDGDFRDLMPMIPALKDSRIVLLGEATHGDGATFSAKARVVKFLHRELGYEVLAFESGLYECEEAWRRIREGTPAAQAVTGAVFGIWSESRQLQPVWNYLDEVRATPHPLRLAGFDMQFTGSLSRDTLAESLRRFLRLLEPGSTEEPEGWNEFQETIQVLFRSRSRFMALGEDRRAAFGAACSRLREWIAARATVHPDTGFWIQALKSIGVLAEFLWKTDFEHPAPGSMNVRDRQMADNLRWLAGERFAGRKIIVWAATSHIIRFRGELKGKNGGEIPDPGMVPMGDILWKALGDQMFTIGFTAHDGRVGVRGVMPWDLAPAREDSLEGMLQSTGREFAFLSFRSLPREGAWLHGDILARPLGHTPMRGDWTRIMDGLVFIRKMVPATALQ